MLNTVSNKLQKLRPSIAPDKANKGRTKSVVGGETAHSSGRQKAYKAANRGHIAEKHKTWHTANRAHRNAQRRTWRAANSDTVNAKRKTWRATPAAAARRATQAAADREKRFEAARAWLRRHGHADKLLDPAAVEAECQRLLNQRHPELQDRNLWALMHDKNKDFAAYVGFTQQLEVKREAYAFLGTRGSRRRGGQRNRYILARGPADPATKRHFTALEAQKELGMQFKVVYESTVKVNAYAVEAALQNALRKIQLGRRLWRWEAMGQPELHKMPDKNLYKVFITFSFQVQAAIHDQKCIVQP